MAGGQFLTLFHATSRSSLAKPCRPFFYNTNKNYGQANNGNRGHMMEERARSTAEEFQRVAEEKAMETKMASQNVDHKSYGGAQEGTIEIDDTKVESVYKEQKFGADYHRRG